MIIVFLTICIFIIFIIHISFKLIHGLEKDMEGY
jgi:hypothetical protein